MVPTILYIIWLLLIMVIIFVSVLTSVNRGNEIEAASYPSNWCYADWMCGESKTTGKVESPLLTLIPTMYSCRSENFSQEAVGDKADGKMLTCVCPIQYEYKHNTGANLNKTGIERFKIYPDPTSTRKGIHICDNISAGQAVLDAKAYKKQTVRDTPGGPCSVSTCQKLWKSDTFTSKVTEKTIGQIKPGPPSSTPWPWPSSSLGVPRARGIPVPWDVYKTGNYPDMPSFDGSMILNQLKRT